MGHMPHFEHFVSSGYLLFFMKEACQKKRENKKKWSVLRLKGLRVNRRKKKKTPEILKKWQQICLPTAVETLLK